MSRAVAHSGAAPPRSISASRRRPIARVWAFLWRGVVVFLALQITTLALMMYLGDAEGAPPPIRANAFADPFLLIHVIAGSLALGVGPLQFFGPVRRRLPSLHRLTGFIYVAACGVSAPAAFILAIGSTAGPFAGAGFAVLATLLALTTLLGLRAAIRKRFTDHREWMIRSYALTATAVTLRLMLLATGLAGWDFELSYLAIAWLSWITNLALSEAYIRAKRNINATLADSAVPIPG